MIFVSKSDGSGKFFTREEYLHKYGPPFKDCIFHEETKQLREDMYKYRIFVFDMANLLCVSSAKADDFRLGCEKMSNEQWAIMNGEIQRRKLMEENKQ